MQLYVITGTILSFRSSSYFKLESKIKRFIVVIVLLLPRTREAVDLRAFVGAKESLITKDSYRFVSVNVTGLSNDAVVIMQYDQRPERSASDVDRPTSEVGT